jgi:hypothetical protein
VLDVYKQFGRRKRPLRRTMAQSYFSAPAQSSSSLPKEPSLSSFCGEKHLKVEDVQEAYIEQKDRFVWKVFVALLAVLTVGQIGSRH